MKSPRSTPLIGDAVVVFYTGGKTLFLGRSCICLPALSPGLGEYHFGQLFS